MRNPSVEDPRMSLLLKKQVELYAEPLVNSDFWLDVEEVASDIVRYPTKATKEPEYRAVPTLVPQDFWKSLKFPQTRDPRLHLVAVLRDGSHYKKGNTEPIGRNTGESSSAS